MKALLKATVKPTLKTLVGGVNYHEIDNNKEGSPNVSGLAGTLTSWASRINGKALEWILAVKKGQDLMKTEDINTRVMKTFQEYRI